jgi:hypothetical protein
MPTVLIDLKAATAFRCRGEERHGSGGVFDHGTYEEDGPGTCLEEGKRALQRAQELAARFSCVPVHCRTSEE